MRSVIISGGTISNIEWLAGNIKNDDRVICVDGGARYATMLGLVPHTIIGDMDSIHQDDLDRLSSQGTVIIKHPAEKDDTDTALALQEAMAGKPDEIIIFGAAGTRLDHTLANIHLLRTAAEREIPARIVNEHNEIKLVTPNHPVIIEGVPGDLFSLLPLTTEVKGVQVKGARWPLENAVFEIGNPYGISNRLALEKAEISISSGLLLLIRVNERGEINCR